MKQTDRDSLQRWEEFKEDIYKDVPVEENLSRAEIEKHRTWLEAHPIEWIKFFFLAYAKSEFADFQKRRSKDAWQMTNGTKCSHGREAFQKVPSPCLS